MAKLDIDSEPRSTRPVGKVLTPENYSEGFLIDEAWMAGVTATEPGFLAYVVDHDSGESLLSVEVSDLSRALALVNSVSRGWAFEKASPCGECGPGGCTRGTNSGCGKCQKFA